MMLFQCEGRSAHPLRIHYRQNK